MQTPLLASWGKAWRIAGMNIWEREGGRKLGFACSAQHALQYVQTLYVNFLPCCRACFCLFCYSLVCFVRMFGCLVSCLCNMDDRSDRVFACSAQHTLQYVQTLCVNFMHVVGLAFACLATHLCALWGCLNALWVVCTRWMIVKIDYAISLPV